MIRLLFSVIFCIAVSVCFGQTQPESNQKAHKDFQKADQELNSIYRNILTAYKADISFIKNLKIAQRIWIQLRDAEMNAKYPNRKDGYYGSVQPMCRSMYLTELTEERINRLKVWLTGIEEGDVCSGSVKAKN